MVAAGRLILNEDGTLQFPELRNPDGNWVLVPNGPGVTCRFNKSFLFREIYASAAVPDRCRNCFKIIVAPRTVSELVAAWQVGKDLPYLSKWGIDLDNKYSPLVYAGCIYTSGIDEARTALRQTREAMAASLKIKADLKIELYRGCAEFEAALGPSDRYTFTPEQKELEAYLFGRLRKTARCGGDELLSLAYWLNVAYRIGDASYLEFTGGMPLHPKRVAYEP
jgi:hypothetical protein